MLTGPKIGLVGRGHAQLAAAMANSRSHRPVPPRLVRAQDGHISFVASPAAATVKVPAMLLAGDLAAARTIEGAGRQAAVADVATPGIVGGNQMHQGRDARGKYGRERQYHWIGGTRREKADPDSNGAADERE